MIIHKKPEFEDDSMMLVIDLKKDILAHIYEDESKKDEYEYYKRKIRAFKNKDISKHLFEQDKSRKSFTNFDDVEDLSGTIYTYTCEPKNRLDYEHIIKFVSKNHKRTRRCAVNFADTLYDYLHISKNTSCLNSIHYYKKNITLYFRASDLKNELLIDLQLIKLFFIDTVQGDFETLTVMSSTAQNIEFNLNNLIQ